MNVGIKSVIYYEIVRFLITGNTTRHLTSLEVDEIKQYIINLLNICESYNDMYIVIPKELHNYGITGITNITGITPTEGTELSNKHSTKKFIEFQKKNKNTYKKIQKLLTIKLLME